MTTVLHDFETTYSNGLYHHHCRACGVWRVSFTKRYNQRCPKARDYSKCAHRGEVKRLVPCKGCNKSAEKDQYKLKVFVCSEFGECTISKFVAGVACCSKPCLSYQEKIS